MMHGIDSQHHQGESHSPPRMPRPVVNNILIPPSPDKHEHHHTNGNLNYHNRYDYNSGGDPLLLSPVHSDWIATEEKATTTLSCNRVLNRGVRNSYQWYGLFLYKHTFVVAVLALLVSTGLSFGMFSMNTLNVPDDLWLKPDDYTITNRARRWRSFEHTKEQLLLVRGVPLSSHTCGGKKSDVVIEHDDQVVDADDEADVVFPVTDPRNVLTPAHIRAYFDLRDKIYSIKVWSKASQRYFRYKDMCLQYGPPSPDGSSCYEMSVLDFWQGDRATFEKDKDPIYGTMLPPYGPHGPHMGRFGPIHRDFVVGGVHVLATKKAPPPPPGPPRGPPGPKNITTLATARAYKGWYYLDYSSARRLAHSDWNELVVAWEHAYLKLLNADDGLCVTPRYRALLQISKSDGEEIGYMEEHDLHVVIPAGVLFFLLATLPQLWVYRRVLTDMCGTGGGGGGGCVRGRGSGIRHHLAAGGGPIFSVPTLLCGIASLFLAGFVTMCLPFSAALGTMALLGYDFYPGSAYVFFFVGMVSVHHITLVCNARMIRWFTRADTFAQYVGVVGSSIFVTTACAVIGFTTLALIHPLRGVMLLAMVGALSVLYSHVMIITFFIGVTTLMVRRTMALEWDDSGGDGLDASTSAASLPSSVHRAPHNSDRHAHSVSAENAVSPVSSVSTSYQPPVSALESPVQTRSSTSATSSTLERDILTSSVDSDYNSETSSRATVATVTSSTTTTSLKRYSKSSTTDSSRMSRFVLDEDSWLLRCFGRTGSSGSFLRTTVTVLLSLAVVGGVVLGVYNCLRWRRDFEESALFYDGSYLKAFLESEHRWFGDLGVPLDFVIAPGTRYERVETGRALVRWIDAINASEFFQSLPTSELWHLAWYLSLLKQAPSTAKKLGDTLVDGVFPPPDKFYSEYVPRFMAAPEFSAPFGIDVKYNMTASPPDVRVSRIQAFSIPLIDMEMQASSVRSFHDVCQAAGSGGVDIVDGHSRPYDPLDVYVFSPPFTIFHSFDTIRHATLLSFTVACIVIACVCALWLPPLCAFMVCFMTGCGGIIVVGVFVFYGVNFNLDSLTIAVHVCLPYLLLDLCVHVMSRVNHAVVPVFLARVRHALDYERERQQAARLRRVSTTNIDDWQQRAAASSDGHGNGDMVAERDIDAAAAAARARTHSGNHSTGSEGYDDDDADTPLESAALEFRLYMHSLISVTFTALASIVASTFIIVASISPLNIAFAQLFAVAVSTGALVAWLGSHTLLSLQVRKYN